MQVEEKLRSSFTRRLFSDVNKDYKHQTPWAKPSSPTNTSQTLRPLHVWQFI